MSPFAFVLGSQIVQQPTGTFFERLEALGGQMPVRGSRQGQNHLACLDIAKDIGPPVSRSASDGAVLRLEFGDLLAQIVSDALWRPTRP